MATRQIVSNNIEVALKGLFRDAIATAFPAAPVPDVLVVPGKFADFQCNNAMALAKVAKQPPKAVAASLIAALPANDMIKCADTTDQGFINVTVDADWLAAMTTRTLGTGLQPPELKRERVLVDFSSPNIAKEMHVGHLRSTIIGECICRILEYVGHDVKRINHVGDWGTQFGMLILYMKQQHPDFLSVPPPISDLVMFYKAAKQKFDEDSEFKDQARLEVVKLQALEDESIKAWKLICDLSRIEFQQVYDRLEVQLEERGESFYNPMIPDVLQMLHGAKQVETSDGAEIIVSKASKPADKIDHKDVSRMLQYFVNAKRDGSVEFNATLLDQMRAINVVKATDAGEIVQLTPKESRPLAKFDVQKDLDKLAKAVLALFKAPMNAEIAKEVEKLQLGTKDALSVPRFAFPLMARKSDGGYTYDTTDLAAAYHRFCVEKHDRVVYVTDSGQFEHFRMVLQTAEDMGWMQDGKRWAHAGFGLVSGADGKKLKTRSGDTTKLKDLLDEACLRSLENLKKREEEAPQGFTDAEMQELSKTIGYGAVKYFDLKQNRTTDYTFSYDKMLDFNGNTAVFLLYSYARICSIKKKAGVALEDIADTKIVLGTEKERQLALALLKFEPTIIKTCEDLFPHHITDFCYELVNCFSGFFTECKVVGDPMQNSRLLLIELVGNTLKLALSLLGIRVAQRL